MMNKLLLRRICVLTAMGCTLALALPASHANDKGKAKMMIKRATHAMSEARCHVSACPEVFVKAVAQFEQALKLDPSPETALLFCQLYRDLDSTNDKLAVEQGLAQKALTRCDFAAHHPDSTKQVRERARSGGTNLRNILSAGRDKATESKRRIAAAKALYGVGLKMKYDKKAGSISLAYGTLDAKTLQSYISEYWSEQATSVLRVAIPNSRMLNPGQSDRFFANARIGVTGWIMAEPMAKYKICKKLVYAVEGGREVEQWCKYQALIEGNAPIFAFRGKNVSWPVKQMAGGGLGLDERIFLPTIDGVYRPAISIAGPVEIDDYKHNRLTNQLAYDIRTGKYVQQALAIRARGKKIAAKKEKAYNKKDRKIGGKRGKVVFAAATFVGWDLPKLLSKKAAGVSCDVLNYKAYAPRKKGRDYEMDIKVDGKICNATVVGSAGNDYAKAQSVMHPEYGGDSGDACPQALLVPGKHKVAVAIYEVKASKTGRKQINRDWTVSDEYMAYRGKKKASGSMSCTTTGPAVESRFE